MKKTIIKNCIVLLLILLYGCSTELNMVEESEGTQPIEEEIQTQEETEIAKLTNQIGSYVSLTRAGGSNINYSTTEQDTGLKWIDGKTIYQRTFTLTELSIFVVAPIT